MKWSGLSVWDSGFSWNFYAKSAKTRQEDLKECTEPFFFQKSQLSPSRAVWESISGQLSMVLGLVRTFSSYARCNDHHWNCLCLTFGSKFATWQDSATWSSCSSTDQAILVGYEWILMGYLGDSTRWASSVVVSKSCVPWNERPQGAVGRASMLSNDDIMISQ